MILATLIDKVARKNSNPLTLSMILATLIDKVARKSLNSLTSSMILARFCCKLQRFCSKVLSIVPILYPFYTKAKRIYLKYTTNRKIPSALRFFGQTLSQNPKPRPFTRSSEFKEMYGKSRDQTVVFKSVF
jgi:hypothetical protein